MASKRNRGKSKGAQTASAVSDPEVKNPPVEGASDASQTAAEAPRMSAGAEAAASAASVTPESRWRRMVSDSDAWLLSAAVLIGALTAFANTLFHSAIGGAYDFFWGDLGGAMGVGGDRRLDDVFVTGFASLPSQWWLIPVVPMTGMAMIVLLDRWFPGEIKGYGLPRFLEIVNVKGGFIRRRWITLKTLSSSITLGSGMSTGVEGPIAQIGGSIGSTVGRALRPSPERLRVLIACGTASAIASTFSSPIAGVMFAVEIVLIGASQLQSLSLIVLASGTATVISEYMRGHHSVLHAPHFEFEINHELLFYVMLGLVSGLLAVFFIRSFYTIGDWFRATRIPVTLRPLLGGLIVGCSLIVFPQVASSGYPTMNATFEGHFSAPLLLSIAVVKILMTGVTLGCGGSGGVFAPSMFIGATFGGGFAAFVNYLLPDTIAHPGSFALIGMGAFLSAATHAPMTSIFLLFELTRDYSVVLPIMITAVTATLVARRVFPDSIDHYELSRRGVDLHSGGETNILKTLYVRGLATKDYQPIPETMPLSDFLSYVTNSRYTHFPVVNDEGVFRGVVSLNDLRGVLLQRESWPFVLVTDLADADVPSVRPSDSLFEAMEAISSRGVEYVPVVDEDDGQTLVGMLRRSDLQDVYQRRLLARELAA